jgi:response regulator of citrate/malate metabolism
MSNIISAPSTSQITVLIVDDDFMVADVHRRLVERHDAFRVIGVAHSAAAALAAIREFAPDLVLLDIYLPDRNGVELLSAIRSIGSTAEVIAITAARDSETVAAIMRLGGLRYLLKPFDPLALTAQLDQIRDWFALRQSSSGSGDLNQQRIDELVAARHPVAASPPKGVSSETLDVVVRFLAGLGQTDLAATASATEVATGTGVSRASARRYLEHLADTGRADRTLRYGTAGRPEHQYRLR